MTRPRFTLLLLLTFALLMTAGRLLLELGTAMAGGDVRTDLRGAPHEWLVIALWAASACAVSAAVAWPHVQKAPTNKLLRGVKARVVALACVSLVGCSSCATLKEQGRAVAGDVVDCMTDQAKQLDEQFGPVFEKLLQLATQSDGDIDWQIVKDTSRNLAVDGGRCVLARAVARLLHPPARDANAPQSAHLEVDRSRALAGWRELADGKVYRTPDGDI